MENYKEIKEKVWDRKICSGCSICTVVCPMKTIYFLDDKPTSHNYCKNEKDQVPCGACFSCCPRIDTFKDKYGLGNVKSFLSARAKIEISKKQSGGAITAILYNALKNKMIDCVVMVGQDPSTLKTYSVAIQDPDILLCYAGSRYVWYTPSMTALRDVVESGKARRIAIVGTPCVIQAVRKMINSENDVLSRFKDHISLLIGVFCTEIFNYERAMKYINENDIDPSDIKKVDIKKNLIVDLYNGKSIEIPIKKEIKKEGCNYCLDFSAVDADISAGSIGSEAGYTTIISRTNIGELFLNSAIENDYLEVHKLDSTDVIVKFANRKKNKNIKNIENLKEN